MSARAVLEIRHKDSILGDGIREHLENEYGHGWFDYWGLWSERHPEDCEWAGINWIDYPEGIPVARLPQLIKEPIPLILPDLQLIEPPEQISNEKWAPIFQGIIDLYRDGDFLAALLYGHS